MKNTDRFTPCTWLGYTLTRVSDSPIGAILHLVEKVPEYPPVQKVCNAALTLGMLPFLIPVVIGEQILRRSDVPDE